MDDRYFRRVVFQKWIELSCFRTGVSQLFQHDNGRQIGTIGQKYALCWQWPSSLAAGLVSQCDSACPGGEIQLHVPRHKSFTLREILVPILMRFLGENCGQATRNFSLCKTGLMCPVSVDRLSIGCYHLLPEVVPISVPYWRFEYLERFCLP